MEIYIVSLVSVHHEVPLFVPRDGDINESLERYVIFSRNVALLVVRCAVPLVLILGSGSEPNNTSLHIFSTQRCSRFFPE